MTMDRVSPRPSRSALRRAVGWIRRLGGRVEDRLVRNRLPRLDPADAALQQANRQLEQTFAGMSETFVPLHERIEALLKNCDDLVALASGRRDGMTLFQEGVQVLHGPIEYIDFCVTRHARVLELFASTERRTQAMLDFQKEMESMLAPLTYIEVLIKIESASLEQEQRDTFLTVVAEIERLHNLVYATFERNTTLLSDIHGRLAQIRRKLETDFNRHATHTKERRTQIEEAINSLDTQLTSNSGRDVKIQRFSHGLADRVNSIVMAIQTQDIVSQKSGHVLEALGELKDNTTGAGHILDVQVSQLGQIGADIEHAHREITGAISDIEAQADEIDRNSIALDEFTQMTASADGMVQQLLDAFGSVREIIASTLELTREARAAAEPASNIASDLSTTLGELSINMRLIALNAQVRSLQITQGTGLEILAARTASISGEISATSDQVARDLALLRDETQEVLTLLGEFEANGSQQLNHLTSHSPGAESRLHELRDRALALMGTIGETAGAIHESAKQSATCLQQMPGVIETVGAARRELQLQLIELGHRPDTEACEHTQARLEDHARRYTMASERHVHDTGTPSRLPASRGAANPHLTGAGGDVDFFTDPADSFTPSPAPAAPPPAAAPPTPPSAPAPVAVASPVVPAALGDNVDLF